MIIFYYIKDGNFVNLYSVDKDTINKIVETKLTRIASLPFYFPRLRSGSSTIESDIISYLSSMSNAINIENNKTGIIVKS